MKKNSLSYDFFLLFSPNFEVYFTITVPASKLCQQKILSFPPIYCLLPFTASSPCHLARWGATSGGSGGWMVVSVVGE